MVLISWTTSSTKNMMNSNEAMVGVAGVSCCLQIPGGDEDSYVLGCLFVGLAATTMRCQRDGGGLMVRIQWPGG